MTRIFVNSLKNIHIKDGNILFDLGEETSKNGNIQFEMQISLILSKNDCSGITKFLTDYLARTNPEARPPSSPKQHPDALENLITQNDDEAEQNELVRVKLDK